MRKILKSTYYIQEIANKQQGEFGELFCNVIGDIGKVPMFGILSILSQQSLGNFYIFSITKIHYFLQIIH